MYIQLGDVRLFFDVEGAVLAPDGPVHRERPTVLCLHGGPGLDHSTLRPGFSELAEHAQVIYLDQRGHGRSDRGDPTRWTLARWAADVHEFCQALGIVRPIVLGTSFGGYVAMEYAIRYPSHPAKIVLISTSPRGTGNPERRERVFDAFARRGGAAASEVARRAFDERTPAAFAEYVRVCGPLYTSRPPDPDGAKRVIANNEILPRFEAPGAEGVTFDQTSRLPRVRCPVLIVGGSEDPITPIAEQQLIAGSLPAGQVDLVEIPDCGHGVLRDAPQRLLELVAEFVVAT
ncbi:alpha/beta fold hydrolase [Amycolatopsis cihanbeyliensis]|uniref:Proline iminopeptidase n=1 Tax=Amycolatopsis cihanbeyliensis TaxID=1128664 RepID=A0A542DBI2_AMYCI|nr:alpha/beta hydrolase [Amycolatopsis cihanbeyliensis]TQJ00440.1 proline iminopeptidase [Amycolatopsis cihanbeyliensis]